MANGNAKTLGLVAAGSMLEFYEFQTSAIFLSIIGTVFFASSQPEWVRDLQAIALFSVSFIFRPVAAIIVGRIGDREGRKRSFLLTLLLMAIPTIAIGLLPTYAMIGAGAPILLLFLRIMQAMASAGELSGAAVFTNELAGVNKRGLASGSLYGAIHLGYFLAAAVAAAVTTVLTREQVLSFGWRIPFLLGGALGFVALIARRKLHESPAFLAARKDARRKAPLSTVVRDHKLAMFSVVLLAGYVGSTIAVIYTFTPLFLQTAYHVKTSTTAWVIMVAFLFLSASAVLWGWIADKVGATRALRIGATCGIAVVCSAGLLGVDPRSPQALLGWFALASLAMGNVGCAFQVGTSLFPASIRLTGFGVSYNLGLALFVSTVPLSLTILSHRFGATAMVAYIVVAAALGIAATLIADQLLRNAPADTAAGIQG
ncbi:MFS transporter [Sphingomonas sp. QA11]|uniref:MFS transporter n=1 Tax=Sphingomonas sp. QA11 TaxID=2950605 RepID=UPI00234B08D1|nr:MFS transporter [Sphingomonas sp. QA11]WCM25862.1 MFS transporter [Sphingomonas sp. QA11]